MSVTSLDTVAHIPLVESATFFTDATIAITINDTIKPYSTAVAPCSHPWMRRIRPIIFWLLFITWLRAPLIFHTSVNKTLRLNEKMEKNPTMLFVVAAALTNQAGEILLQKRPEGRQMAGLWEFPGGKVDSGESPESALARELLEELDVVVDPFDLHPFSFASEPLGNRNLLLLLYICDIWQGDPKPLESPEIRWLKPTDMHMLPMPPADKPLVMVLQERCRI
jgi:8-oxo-dGTP diphosphatase